MCFPFLFRPPSSIVQLALLALAGGPDERAQCKYICLFVCAATSTVDCTSTSDLFLHNPQEC
ncbi:hypothetical protein KP509_01G011400 [Ceratopteris richardii]|nr:hypothetical protein KP509_01G011400 [Ceratopteris richardii]